jgi:hypothetical protein
VTIADTLADPVTVEATVLGRDDSWDDFRIARILTMLSPDESRVAAAYSASNDMTWETAAHATNMPVWLANASSGSSWAGSAGSSWAGSAR